MRLNDVQLVLRGPKCNKTISTTPLHHHKPEPLLQSRMDPRFHVFYVKFGRLRNDSHQPRQPFSNLLWSSAAVAFCLTCCAFRSSLLHTSVGTSGYLNYCFLSISSNQSGHSPLTSTRHFHPQICFSYLFQNILCKP